MSSCFIDGVENGLPAPSASAALKVVWPGSDQGGTILRRTTKLTIAPLGKPNMSPMLATITCLMPVLGSASCSTDAKFSSTTMASAPESLS